jgi:hypothetical protein
MSPAVQPLGSFHRDYLHAINILDQVRMSNGTELFECIPGQGQLVPLTDAIETEDGHGRVILLVEKRKKKDAIVAVFD